MLYRFCFELDDWDELLQTDQGQWIADTVRRLVAANVVWLLRGERWRTTPALYTPGLIRYQGDGGQDGALNLWQNLPRVMRQGFGHCVGLSAWRCAELAVRGENAKVEVTIFHETRPGVGLVQEFHVTVRRANGTREDPARLLGMP
jgi:hypothetical protein